MNRSEEFYTPDIEEFHVGFQYEEQMNIIDSYYINSKEDLIKETQMIRDLGISTMHSYLGWVPKIYKFQEPIGKTRVRNLDIDDLRKCGFTVGDLPWQYFDGIHKLVDLDYGNISITHEADEQCLFYGEIKNISEFIKLLKQLDIWYGRG